MREIKEKVKNTISGEVLRYILMLKTRKKDEANIFIYYSLGIVVRDVV